MMRIKLIALIIVIVFVILLTVSCETYDNHDAYADPPSESNSEIIELYQKIEALNQKNESYIEEIKNIEDALKEMEFMRDTRHREAMEYREDISRLLKLLDNELLGPLELPVYKGFDRAINKQHINTIDRYLANFKDERVSGSDYAFNEGLEPIFYYLSVKPTEPMLLPKKEDVHYYEVVFYWSLIPAIGIERDSFLTRGPFDGLSRFILQIKKIDNEWQVIDFGQDS